MNEIVATLISGRTIEQGSSLETGKTSDGYQTNTSIIELSPSDFETLKLDEGETVRVESKYGSILLKCRRSADIQKGIAFMPYGPWANRLFGSDTHCSGMPQLKGIEVRVKPEKEGRVSSIFELIDELKRL